jgi:eukaryotic-like serine/threonine-protein kinase
MTTPAQFQKLRQWMHELIDLAPGQQADRLAQIRADDVESANALEGLLGKIVATDLLPPLPGDQAVAPGKRIGAFELVEQIGAGGMGLVYRARRVDGVVEQRVAIKLPGRSFLTLAEQHRLHRERDLLARLEHPNIARLIDAGNEVGIGPWFAMEFVNGPPITQFADHQRLAIPARLSLWLQLCDAVNYAHQHLIVHRDLKPANVLVDSAGQVKLLDFGIANLFSAQIDAAQSTPAFTPRYASPEQITGAPVTTATDVHGLGVLLYELLCGCPAFAERGDLALRQSIATAEPPKMSAVLAQLDSGAMRSLQESRGQNQAQWLREISGELEAIVAKSLRKVPRERYASVNDFAQDVRSHLRGDKVQAMQPTRAYRVAKFVRKHRVALAFSTFFIGALCVGLLSTLIQRNRALAAESAAQLARAQTQAENGMLVDILGGGPDTLRGGADMRVRDLLRSSAQVIAARADLAPLSRARLLHTLAEGLLSLLDDDAAESVLATAQQCLNGVDDPTHLLLRIQLKRSWIRFEHGEQKRALDETEKLWPALTKVGGAALLEALQNRAHFHANLREFKLALEDLDAGQKLALSLQPRPERDLSQLRYNRIYALANLDRNEEAYQLALVHLAAANAQPPEQVSARINATEMFARTASKVDRFGEAQTKLLAILPAAETLYQGKGNRLASLVGALGSAYRAGGKMREAARAHHRQAQLRQDSLPDSLYVASALRYEGISLRGVGDMDGARNALQRARVLFVKLNSNKDILHCDVHLAAVEAQARPGSETLSAMRSQVNRITKDGEPSDQIEAPMLLIEAALRDHALGVAQTSLAALQDAVAKQSASKSTQAAVAMFAAELATAQGQKPDLSVLAKLVEPTGDVGLLARLADLRLQQGDASLHQALCVVSRSAWQQVDDQAGLWKTKEKKLDCAAAESVLPQAHST